MFTIKTNSILKKLKDKDNVSYIKIYKTYYHNDIQHVVTLSVYKGAFYVDKFICVYALRNDGFILSSFINVGNLLTEAPTTYTANASTMHDRRFIENNKFKLKEFTDKYGKSFD